MVVKTKCKYCGTEYEYTTYSEEVGEVEHFEKCPNCGYFYNFSYSRPHTNRQYFEELLELREFKRKKEREESVINLLPKEEFKQIMAQKECEYCDGFMGFEKIYRALSEIIPKDKIIIDFGCYLAAQAYFFKAHRYYVGVDVIDMQRFTPNNATHCTEKIQDFINNRVHDLFGNRDPLEFFAICSYVPSEEARELVRKTFPNVFVYYPYTATNTKPNKN